MNQGGLVSRIGQWLDALPFFPLIIAALILGGAPFIPEPHLVEKIRMLLSGSLIRPIDIFDLFYHGLFPFVVVLKVFRALALSKARGVKAENMKEK
jgi:hypothetical protein